MAMKLLKLLGYAAGAVAFVVLFVVHLSMFLQHPWPVVFVDVSLISISWFAIYMMVRVTAKNETDKRRHDEVMAALKAGNMNAAVLAERK